jgi:hypothetical protein
MARARNIKPSLFKNEVLGVADPLLTILFASLWCLADKAGRLEDRPLRIKGETFPYRDGIDVDSMLIELEKTGFIRRYVVGELRLIQVLNFVEHQKPHHTEKESKLPEFSMTCHVTVKNPCEDALIPDSLNTDSPIPEEGVAATAAAEEIPVERRIWRDGVELLKRSGLNELQARPLLGRWVKDYTREETAKAIASAQAVNSPDPKSYIGKVLSNTKASKAASNVGKYEQPMDCERCGGTTSMIENGLPVPCSKCDRPNYEAYHELLEMEKAA